MQDALLRALQTWPYRGVPDNPRGWLFQVARNRAFDLLRREDVLRRKLYEPAKEIGRPSIGETLCRSGPIS